MASEPSSSGQPGGSTRSAIGILLAVIATILVVAALQAVRPVAMPLAFAVLIAILVNPLRHRLNRSLPRWLSLTIVLLVILVVLGILAGLLLLGVEQAGTQLPQYAEQLQQLWQRVSGWLQSQGLPVNTDGTQAWQGALSQAIGGLRSLLGSFSLFVLILSLLALLLLEVDDYRDRTRAAFSTRTGDRLIDAFTSMSQKLRRYFLVMTFTSTLTGLLTLLWCWLLSIQLAVVWGLIAFVLNFVPTLGSIIAALLPAIAALLFQGPSKAAAVLVGLGVMQVILGNFVDPKLQGKYLKLSPFIALLSIVFWGWVWGIPGAFIGVPMTAAIILLTSEFQLTRPVATMLGDMPDSR
ncbi:MAG: AI-2E family transporter [Leptolyngbya sp. SIO4C1]|nr:AI-2E family transporter [Leptolyngbya sp. SIO4C1]